MCNLKCSKCKESVIEITNIDISGESTGHINSFGHIVEYEKTIHTQGTKRILFCKDCREFYDYFEVLYPEGMEDYIKMDNISLNVALKRISEIFSYAPEYIDFKALREVFSLLNVDLRQVTKTIAYNIVSSDKPTINIHEDEVIPF
ncbi:MAG: hypothetical protein IJ086_15335 [Clostridium sp.]|nr:hypothetical protein [Clostridium sp.]MBQ9000049.1 hypothetical protein [Clostridium sp.]